MAGDQWNNFGEGLAVCLNKVGWTQRELARRIGVDPKTINALVRRVNQTPQSANLTSMLEEFEAAGIEEEALDQLRKLGKRRRRESLRVINS